MKYFEFKSELQKQELLAFIMPNGISFPAHFHITEIGRTQKQFVDCGGTIRNIGEINIQLWLADDTNHRLTTKKLLQIMHETESKIILPDEEILVELQEIAQPLHRGRYIQCVVCEALLSPLALLTT